ncbi:DNA-directed RNA polymerase subunit P [Candidatus Woesearchaeota archaeon CG_4_10_14_0_8_um_filter_47_5]|nr:MAG: DNA-directed RNA polymerase subunit P [Candidatus Woesearchaeota archaeon CG_4_10_14_0_8_um_filter_47_5]
MVEYKCMSCNKAIGSNLLRKRIRCPYCGYKILFKPRATVTKISAR